MEESKVETMPRRRRVNCPECKSFSHVNHKLYLKKEKDEFEIMEKKIRNCTDAIIPYKHLNKPALRAVLECYKAQVLKENPLAGLSDDEKNLVLYSLKEIGKKVHRFDKLAEKLHKIWNGNKQLPNREKKPKGQIIIHKAELVTRENFSKFLKQ